MQVGILDWFIAAKEAQFPVKGVLGGTMMASYIHLPRDFRGRAGEEFFVTFEDGHAVETTRYREGDDLFWRA